MKSKLNRTIRATAWLCVFCAATELAWGQSEHPVAINIGGGFTPLVGNVSTHLDNGWHITGGVGYNILPSFTLGLQFTYNGFGVPRSTLAAAKAPDGDSHVWSLTVEPRLQLPILPKLRPYLVGGVGYYRRTVDFTRPALQQVTFFDPFFGFVFPGFVGVNQVLARVTRNGPGGSLGAGWAIKLGSSGTQFFSEARYQYAATGAIPTRMVPVTFGIRF